MFDVVTLVHRNYKHTDDSRSKNLCYLRQWDVSIQKLYARRCSTIEDVKRPKTGSVSSAMYGTEPGIK